MTGRAEMLAEAKTTDYTKLLSTEAGLRAVTRWFLQRDILSIASLSRSNGGLYVDLMQRVVVAAVNFVARNRDLVERPEGPVEELANVAERSSKSYHRPAEVYTSIVSEARSVPTACWRPT